MTMNHLLLVIGFLACGGAGSAQKGKIIRFASHYSMFPDSARVNGHDYQGIHYAADKHYSDSTVLIYVPHKINAKNSINLVCWFHGWGNNIDTACKQFQLLEQFESSGRNAVFIFPEGPKNAPDSYGGKLEKPAVVQQLINEVFDQLLVNKQIKKPSALHKRNYTLTLAGHSGAYRVISKIMNHQPVKEVILFDALYGGNEDYLKWLSTPETRFINIYTKDGGTFDNSHLVMDRLSDSLHIPFVSINEAAVDEQLLRSNLKIFIFSTKGHNEVILHNRNWQRFLRNLPAGN